MKTPNSTDFHRPPPPAALLFLARGGGGGEPKLAPPFDEALKLMRGSPRKLSRSNVAIWPVIGTVPESQGL